MKKNKVFNVMMVVLIAAIIGIGVVIVGMTRGWFKATDPNALIVNEIIGAVQMERNGVGYSAENGAVLKQEDILATKQNAKATIEAGGNTFVLNENTEIVVTKNENGVSSFDVTAGEVFAVVNDASKLENITFQGKTLKVKGTVFGISVQSGSASVACFEGKVDLGDREVDSGHILSYSGGKANVGTLTATSLNAFVLDQAIAASDSRTLCFAKKDFEKVVADRAAEKKAQIEKMGADAVIIGTDGEVITTGSASGSSGSNPSKSSGKTGSQSQSSGSAKTSGSSGSQTSGSSTAQSSSIPQSSGSGSSQSSSSGGSGSGSEGSGGGTGGGSETETTPSLTCTITIRCDTILNNMGNLAAGKSAYVPANGVILSTSKVAFEEGETVYDVLKRVCDYADIQMEASWTPMYNSYYVEGINNLYEFDCGSESGWMYKVNGWFPDYGCSSYTLKDGDDIVWCYTCNGLGADVGGGMY